MGDPTKVRVGPGKLYVAPLGTVEPTDLTTAWDVAWTPLGYTDDGHTFTATPTLEAIPVAEELDPIRWEPTGREMRVEFALAEITATNLSYALNGGTVTTGTGTVTFEPPDTGSITRTMLGWESDDATERWIFRKCVQNGDVAIARQKAPNKATIPASFMLEIPDNGGKPFAAIFATP